MDAYQIACERFDAENARDPNLEFAGGERHPRELLYARRLTDWVLELAPDASEALRLAARCQHICRWIIPRDSQPMTRAGLPALAQRSQTFPRQHLGPHYGRSRLRPGND